MHDAWPLFYFGISIFPCKFELFTIFTNVNHQTFIKMSIFGIVLFLMIAGMAFWLLLFLLGFIVPFWITLGVLEQMRPKRIFEDKESH